LEAPRHPGAAIAQLLRAEQGAGPTIILLDCLTLLASNVLIGLPEGASEAEATAALLAEVDELLAAMQTGGARNPAPAHWIIVSNEVGLGIVPATPLGRLYRDALGRANQKLAAAADRVVLMVAGIPLAVKG
jgi:adenosylcobinamide kinase/adenosylcobinamide-phosphate guanylyltransferase